MAAKNTRVTVTEGEAWVRLTDSGATVTAATFLNVGSAPVDIMGTTGSAPTDGSEDGIRLPVGIGILSDVTLSTLFPGVSATQVWARARGTDGLVFVSHAA